jgi:hypothetical protein
MRFLTVFFNALSFYAGWTSAAHAEPITATLFGAAFASTFFGGVVTLGITVALQIGANLLISALFPKKSDTSAQPGVNLSLQVGGNVPISFLAGFSGTAGSLTYPGTWGNSNGTPNAYLTQVICISDLPCALTGLWWNDQKVTLPTMTGSPPTPQGWPIAQGAVSGVDYLWVRVLDGSQTTADAFLIDKFGSHPTRPFTSDMIGRGQTHVIMTALVNRDLFSSEPRYFFESTGAKFYNPAKDTSVGGSGAHRWADQTTWEPSSSPAVLIYNIRRGIFYGSQWVYGGNNKKALHPSRLPVANWIAGINACAALVTNADLSTEAAYRAGGEITGDMQPVDVIDELKKSCNARIAEIGGIYKIMVGSPGSAVYSFTDADIVITEGQTYDPFPGLENTHNAIEATYPEPTERWGTKDAPGLYDTDLEDADGGRRLVAQVQYPMVPYAHQVQRLDKAMLLDSRRFAGHGITMPPDAWVLEPGIDVVSWTSARNGYTNKSFLVTQINGARTFNQSVSLKEIDPSDYDWDAAVDQQAVSAGTMTTIRPPAQPLTGWTAVPAIFYDSGGTARRPSIQVGYDGGQVDVRAVRVMVRLKATSAVVFDGEVPYAAPYSVLLNIAGLLPNEIYQAQGDYIPFSGRDHTPSAWLDVTTPNVLLTADDVTGIIATLTQDQQNVLGLLFGTGVGSVAARLDEIEARIAAQAAAALDAQATNKVKTQALVVRSSGNSAAVLREESARVNADGALATLIQEVEASFGTSLAGGLLQFTATAGVGASATVSLRVRAQTGDTFADSGIFIVATSDGAGGTTSQILLKTNQLFVTDGVHSANAFAFDAVSGELKVLALRAGRITSTNTTSMVTDYDNPEIYMEA